MNRDKIKIGLLGAAGGAIVLVIIGFGLAGWVKGGTAQRMAQEAVISKLATICAEQFKQDPEKDQKLNKLKKMDYWKIGSYVGEQGWATMPGEKETDGVVANECANLIMQISQ